MSLTGLDRFDYRQLYEELEKTHQQLQQIDVPKLTIEELDEDKRGKENAKVAVPVTKKSVPPTNKDAAKGTHSILVLVFITLSAQ